MFPITLMANGGDSEFYSIYFKNKPRTLIWFCYDVIIHSPTELEFVTHDMKTPLMGGIGREIHRFRVTVEPDVTLPQRRKQARHLAICKREMELIEAEEAIIQGYTEVFLNQKF